jgi:hypothetical protein
MDADFFQRNIPSHSSDGTSARAARKDYLDKFHVVYRTLSGISPAKYRAAIRLVCS